MAQPGAATHVDISTTFRPSSNIAAGSLVDTSAAKQESPPPASRSFQATTPGETMTALKYEIVEHDGGWAYRVGATYSETFPSHDAALNAARVAAREQRAPGSTTGISWEDEKGAWHEELESGDDRPQTEVQD